MQNIPFYGLGVYVIDHPETCRLAQEVTERRIVTYGLEKRADVRALNLTITPEGIHFEVELSRPLFPALPSSGVTAQNQRLLLPMVGQHNVQNASADYYLWVRAWATHAQIQQGMANFGGVKRRFTEVGQWNNITFIDDYAHHPNEIAAVLNAAKQIARGKVIVVMQPHRYSRFEDLFDDFCTCFDEVDDLIITPIYAAGKSPIQN